MYVPVLQLQKQLVVKLVQKILTVQFHQQERDSSQFVTLENVQIQFVQIVQPQDPFVVAVPQQELVEICVAQTEPSFIQHVPQVPYVEIVQTEEQLEIDVCHKIHQQVL